MTGSSIIFGTPTKFPPSSGKIPELNVDLILSDEIAVAFVAFRGSVRQNGVYV